MTDSAIPITSAEDDESIWKKPPFWRTAPLDAFLLLVLLGIANWYLARADPGWMRLNPTPWLLLPLFLGGRYGISGGIAGAVLATAGVLGLQWFAENQQPIDGLLAHPFFFLALLLAAAVGAIIYHLVAGPSERLRQRAFALAERNRNLEEDASLYRANEVKLVDSLLLHGAESVTLNSELADLIAGDPAKFNENFLGLISREFGVVSAAIYRSDNGNHSTLLQVASTAVGESNFPIQVSSTDSSIAGGALAKNKIASWNSLDSEPGRPEGAGQTHLAAIPWHSSTVASDGHSALLLIGRMDFSRIDWETLGRIEAVFAWCMSQIESGNHSATQSTSH